MTGLSPSPLLAGRTITGPASARLSIDGQPILNFYGSGYLALSQIPAIRQSVADTLAAGAAFAQHVPPAFGAHDPAFAKVETLAARALGAETSIYLPSGHLIGQLGVLAFANDVDAIFIDECAHYNLQDAASLAKAPKHVFAHRDAEALEAALKQSTAKRPLVMTDGVFASTGQLAPLDAYAALVRQRGAQMLVDDSHGVGVVGATGRGSLEHFGIALGRDIGAGATLSKAYCAQGAVLASDLATAQRIKARPPLRGATIGSPLSAAAAAAALDYMAAHPERREVLLGKAARLRDRLLGLGLRVFDTITPIVSFQTGDAMLMDRLQRQALQHDIVLQHSTYVGAGPEGLIRCAVFSDHSDDDFDRLITFLKAAL
jgi:7-keto-8-aminopelargonate synthetase-like enzyme